MRVILGGGGPSMNRIHKILLVSDTWHPAVNGVVRTLDTTIREIQRTGRLVQLIEPGLFRNFACPFYPEFRIAWPDRQQLGGLVEDFDSDAIHIATEGTLGLAMRSHCLARGLRFTTSYHTN